VYLADPAATEAVGACLSDLIRPGDVITLSGPLGAGKTSIARGLLAALGLAGEAPSPSFAIVQPMRRPRSGCRCCMSTFIGSRMRRS
jgi:tRNA threonylcarbamoyladenosine biosynthesis protein TsaE